ncbi:MAG: endonuclease/exonuclease/phosphatase family protein [Bacteroidales bacterium]|jgi:endonuclease/exonuclease/phosphatase family metal-dependent hydrolase|nr:endonuclease/exonuclease/phosphatase family protein [Bacteroidales bacterium]
MKKSKFYICLFISVLTLFPWGKTYAAEIRIMTYNIRVGKGMELAQSLVRTAAVISGEKPDIVMMQEVDSAVARSGGVDQAMELGKLTGMYAVFAPSIKLGSGKYGVAMLSAEKPQSIKMIPLPGREEARMLLIVEFRSFFAATTHFSLTEEDRMESVKILLREADRLKKPFIVGGDFNALPASAELELLKSEFTLLSDGKTYTFPANFPDRCIDYIFISNRFAKRFNVISSSVIPEALASDHRPVMVLGNL